MHANSTADQTAYSQLSDSIERINDFSSSNNHVQTNIIIKNLPVGLTQEGVKNLFLTVGKPYAIHINMSNNSAIVKFDSINKATLAIRDLNNKPPYYLKVNLFSPRGDKNHSMSTKVQDSDSSLSEKFVIAEEISLVTNQKSTYDEECLKTLNKFESLFKNLDYSSSYRIFQKKCDFTNQFSSCVSRGRGYLCMGETDPFIGGLKNCRLSSDNSDGLFDRNYFCEKCGSCTTRICSCCLATFCSNFCLINGSLNHGSEHCRNRLNIQKKPNGSCVYNDRETEKDVLNCVPLVSPCTVVISTYCTLKTLYVQRIDGSWFEKFSRMCNDISLAALQGAKIEAFPRIGELCIAKYHEDKCYYRAEISDVKNQKIAVFFLDFGNIQETHIDDLILIPEHLKKIPRFGVKIDLADIGFGTSSDSVSYFNKLTSEKIPLILTFKDSLQNGTILTEKETGEVVNKRVNDLIMASWKKNPGFLPKIGEVFQLDTLPVESLEVGKTYDLTISFIERDDFEEFTSFWAVNSHSDYFHYVKGELRARILEYCTHFKEDYYLPRENELCLAESNGEWCRCVNLESFKKSCCLFFIDEGKSLSVETRNIRKIIGDFLEAPSQAIRCVLSGSKNLQNDPELRTKVFDLLNDSIGETISRVTVDRLESGEYYVTIPQVTRILTKP